MQNKKLTYATKLIPLILLTFVFVVALQSFANNQDEVDLSQQYSGVLIGGSHPGDFFLIQQDGKEKTFTGPLHLKPYSQESSAILQRLSPGDFINLHGNVINNELVIDSIDSVSLKSLLAAWTERSINIKIPTVFAFLDFSHATITTNNKKLALNYQIVPGGKTGWQIFYSTEDTVRIATLEIRSPKRIIIQTINSDTGNIQDTYYLDKIK